jgi:hypothetical protein
MRNFGRGMWRRVAEFEQQQSMQYNAFIEQQKQFSLFLKSYYGNDNEPSTVVTQVEVEPHFEPNIVLNVAPEPEVAVDVVPEVIVPDVVPEVIVPDVVPEVIVPDVVPEVIVPKKGKKKQKKQK